MNKLRLTILLTLVLFISVISTTYCVFVKSVEKTGTIETTELSTIFLDDTSFLTKVQQLDSSITSIDKNNDLTRITSIPTVTLTDDNIVSTDTSSVPTYLWIDNGTIYYFTIATTIDLNTN